MKIWVSLGGEKKKKKRNTVRGNVQKVERSKSVDRSLQHKDLYGDKGIGLSNNTKSRKYLVIFNPKIIRIISTVLNYHRITREM